MLEYLNTFDVGSSILLEFLFYIYFRGFRIGQHCTRINISEVIEYIRIRFGFESFSSNLEYSDSDSRILETE